MRRLLMIGFELVANMESIVSKNPIIEPCNPSKATRISFTISAEKVIVLICDNLNKISVTAILVAILNRIARRYATNDLI